MSDESTDTPPFGVFFTSLKGSREVGLVIAQDARELERFAKALDAHGFKKSKGVADLLTHPQTYCVIDQQMDKDTYDFVAQYPTGQVEIFDTTTMQSRILSPNYAHTAVIILVEESVLNQIESKGFALRAVVGPTYRS